MSQEFPPQIAPIDPIEAELQNMLGNTDPGVYPEVKPEGLDPLTEAEIDAMFGPDAELTLNEGDMALLGIADANSIEARSLTNRLTEKEHAELTAIDQATAQAAQRVLSTAGAVHTERSVSDAIENFLRSTSDKEDDDTPVGAGR